MRGYYNTYNGLGVTLTKEQERQYNTAYGIAYSYNLTAPRMEDFAAGNGEAIIDYYAQQAYAQNPNAQNSYTGEVKKRLAEIAARNTAKTVTAVALPTTTAQQITAQVAQQAATLPPTTTPTPTQESKPAKTWKDYLLWIALGGVVAFGAYKMLAGGKKKRR